MHFKFLFSLEMYPLTKRYIKLIGLIIHSFAFCDTGDAADGMYFIEDGTVSIRIQQEAGEVEISTLCKGGYFGELALVTHRPRAASAYAATDIKAACKLQICFFVKSAIDHQAFNRAFVDCYGIFETKIDIFHQLNQSFF